MTFYRINHRAPLGQFTFINQRFITFLFRQKLLFEAILARLRQT
jgi:hypothetical protein